MKSLTILFILLSLNGFSQQENPLKKQAFRKCDSSITVNAFGTKFIVCNPDYYKNAEGAFNDAKRMLKNDSIAKAFQTFSWVSFFDSSGIYGWKSNDVRDSLIKASKIDLITNLQGRWLLKWQGSNWGWRRSEKESVFLFQR